MFVNKILSNIFMWDLVLKDLLWETRWYNQNLVWMFGLVAITFFSLYKLTACKYWEQRWPCMSRRSAWADVGRGGPWASGREHAAQNILSASAERNMRTRAGGRSSAGICKRRKKIGHRAWGSCPNDRCLAARVDHGTYEIDIIF